MFERKPATGEKLCDVVATAVWEVRGVPHYHLCQFSECAFGKLQCDLGATKKWASMLAFYGIALQQWGLAEMSIVRSQP